MIALLTLISLLNLGLLLLLLARLRSAENETVQFSLLVGAHDRDELCEKLRKRGITVIYDNLKMSDYLKCHTTRTRFELAFDCELVWKELLVGGWEIHGGSIDEELQELSVKGCSLYKNLSLPFNFLGRTNI